MSKAPPKPPLLRLSTDGSNEAWPAGFGLHILDSVDSTLDEARRVANDLTGPLWIMAHRQTKGRGRRGRAWIDPVGNLASTLVLQAEADPVARALRSFVAAVSLHDALVSQTGRPDSFSLKWPNDVLLNGGKLAGILLESSGPHLAIGIGVNLVSAPVVKDLEPGAVRPVALSGELGLTISAQDMLHALAQAYATREHSFRTYGFDPIRTAWLARAAKLGEVITARTSNSETTGTFETVDGQGNLVLVTPKGRVAIPAADIFF